MSCVIVTFYTNALANPSRSLSKGRTLSRASLAVAFTLGIINQAFWIDILHEQTRKVEFKNKKKGFNYFSFITLHAAAAPPPGEHWRDSLAVSDSSHLQSAIV